MVNEKKFIYFQHDDFPKLPSPSAFTEQVYREILGRYWCERQKRHPGLLDDLNCARCYLTKEAARGGLLNGTSEHDEALLNSVEEGFMSSYMIEYSDSETARL